MFLILLVYLASIVLAQHDCSLYDFGRCSDPSIIFGFNISSSGYSGYQPNNQRDFSHGVSADIATIESFICNRLQSPCNARTDTVAACNKAFQDLSGLSGNNAADAWNSAFGLKHDGCTGGYVATTTVTVFSISLGPSAFTTVTLTSLTTSTTTYTNYVSTNRTPPSQSSTLTITITLPAPPTTTFDSTSSLIMTTTAVASPIDTTRVTTTPTSSQSSSSSQRQSSPAAQSSGPGSTAGGGSPFDSGAISLSTSALGGVLIATCALIYGRLI